MHPSDQRFSRQSSFRLSHRRRKKSGGSGFFPQDARKKIFSISSRHHQIRNHRGTSSHRDTPSVSHRMHLRSQRSHLGIQVMLVLRYTCLLPVRRRTCLLLLRRRTCLLLLHPICLVLHHPTCLDLVLHHPTCLDLRHRCHRCLICSRHRCLLCSRHRCLMCSRPRCLACQIRQRGVFLLRPHILCR